MIAVKTTIHIPTLGEIRRHIKKRAWNGRDFTSKDSNYDVFVGQCEYASTAVSEILTGTGLRHRRAMISLGDWSLRVRGWYSGDLTASKQRHLCDEHAFTHGKHCHSWVEYRGLLIDPTWWQFAGNPIRVYVFKVGDPRYTRDIDA